MVVPGPDAGIEVEHPKWGKTYLKGASVEQAAHPSAPPGDATYWSSRVAHGVEIAPGTSATDFIVRASYLPGFTTAYVKGGEPLSTPGELPFEAAQQLIPLMKLKESTRVVLTVGPRFAPGTDKRVIAADYQKVLRVLAKQRHIPEKDMFYQEAIRFLDACLRADVQQCSTGKQVGLFAAASSPLEAEIGAALRIALP
jgi:hypothetical protein